jgi:hypothetical protein
MSEYNLELKQRQVKIRVIKIIKTYEKSAAGLPAMEIVDQMSRKHFLTAVDFPSYEWEKIKEGSTLEIQLQERVASAKLQRE